MLLHVQIIDTMLMGTQSSSSKLSKSLPLLPREITAVEEQWRATLNGFKAVLYSASECFVGRKAAYQVQLKKVRETCNQAIRNTIEAERRESLLRTQKVLGDAKAMIDAADMKHVQDTASLHDKVAALTSENESLKRKLVELEEKDRLRLIEQNEAVNDALTQLKMEYIEANEKHKEHAREEIEKVKSEAKEQINRLMISQDKAVADIKQLEDEKRDMLVEDREKLAHENKVLREELSKLQVQVGYPLLGLARSK